MFRCLESNALGYLIPSYPPERPMFASNRVVLFWRLHNLRHSVGNNPEQVC